MAATFSRQGVSFQYPENWSAETDEAEDGWSVTIQSPDTAFLTLTFDPGQPDEQEFADAALATLREVYPELEAEATAGSIAGQPAFGYDASFFQFDLTNSCELRAAAAADATILVLWQACDIEETNRQVLGAIRASIVLEDAPNDEPPAK